MKWLLRLAGALAVLILAAVMTLNFWPSFGGRLAGDRLARADASPQRKAGAFDNVVPQSAREAGLLWDYAKRQYRRTEIRTPPGPIPVVPLLPASIAPPPASGLRAVWFGHATVYIEIDGRRVMVDPILSDYASPFVGIGPKRFHPAPIGLDALPKIDAVLISHDHYDHLDMATIKRLAAVGSHFYVPLGIGAHLDRWSVPATQVTELDWWQSADIIGGLKITCTPVRHYSGRSLRDRNATLWSSWAITGPRHRVYYSGDTGTGPHFAETGARLVVRRA